MPAILDLKDIQKSFQDGEEKRTVLNNLQLEVAAGEFVAILGPSGSGKSTLLSIAGVLMSADKGHIILDGQDISQATQKIWTSIRREKIGFVFQSHQLLPYLTVYDQLLMAGKMSRVKNLEQRIKELLNDLGISNCAKKFPKQLSGGQKQRAAIARAFLAKPALILADEPTASLDEARGRQIAELLQKETKENHSAAIMVTHDERILDVVDYVYRLKEGQLFQEK
ncbi:MAG: ABC transporter ATP-binding protein [Streptococcus orisratti]|uniref:ABC transporter ATP-binding protein n=1 Tax=Streptococcus orisratti TaxID=114652 RepID=UPI002A90F8E8|nr:ABC transporter ATP-binding protein [Streptococcus orisratti]MDY5635240.1 ABC transporter ATP-binding protein [Streptococcus orisratti]